jgi:hypothetical protein
LVAGLLKTRFVKQPGLWISEQRSIRVVVSLDVLKVHAESAAT